MTLLNSFNLWCLVLEDNLENYKRNARERMRKPNSNYGSRPFVNKTTSCPKTHLYCIEKNCFPFLFLKSKLLPPKNRFFLFLYLSDPSFKFNHRQCRHIKCNSSHELWHPQPFTKKRKTTEKKDGYFCFRTLATSWNVFYLLSMPSNEEIILWY